LKELGAEGVVMDGLDALSVGEAVAAARPDAIVHQMTALSMAKYGRPSCRHPERFAATTNRLRIEGTDHLLAAAEATGAHVVAQSVAIWFGRGSGGQVTEEETASPEEVGPKIRPAVEAGRHVEDVVVKAGGATLRYGGLYGPGATDDNIELVLQPGATAAKRIQLRNRLGSRGMSAEGGRVRPHRPPTHRSRSRSAAHERRKKLDVL
jgi:hypothetical protein